MAFLYTKNKQAEKEIRETTPFIIVTNNIKYLCVTLTKEVKDLYDKNFKSLKKKNQRRSQKMETSPMPMDWQDQYSKKNAYLAESNLQFNAIPIKIPIQFFTELQRAICKFTWNNKNPRIAKTLLKDKRISGGITMSDLKRTIEQL